MYHIGNVLRRYIYTFIYIRPGFRHLDKDSQRVAPFVFMLSISAVFCFINLLINEKKDQLDIPAMHYCSVRKQVLCILVLIFLNCGASISYVSKLFYRLLSLTVLLDF